MLDTGGNAPRRGQHPIFDISDAEPLPQGIQAALTDASRWMRHLTGNGRLTALRGAAKGIVVADGPGSAGIDALSERAHAVMPDVSTADIRAAIADGAQAGAVEWEEAQAQDASDREGDSEDAIALELVKRYGEDLRYVAKWGKWLHWDGARWKPEDTLRVFSMARCLLRERAKHTDSARAQERLRSAKSRAAVENLCRDDRAVALSTDALDRDIWLLNTPSGTV